MQENSFIDEVMNFDSTSLEVFQEKSTSSTRNANVYKPSPTLSKSEDGHYRSRIRILYNPYAPKRSIVPQAVYTLVDKDGMFFVKSSLGEGDKNCPIFKSFKKLRYSNDLEKEEWAKKMFEKTESQWCLVQVLEDENQPEMVGQVKVMKLPKAIFTKMSAKMNPSAESKKEPVPVMDYLIGLPLDMDVTPGPDDPKNPSRKLREISYDLCEFDTEFAPIMKLDGSALFSDEEMELIEKFNEIKKKVSKAKTDKAKADAQKEQSAIAGDIKVLYQKALSYLKDEAKVVNLEQECAYQPWDQATTDRVNNWIKNVLEMKDPKTVDVNETAAPEAASVFENVTESSVAEDIPF